MKNILQRTLWLLLLITPSLAASQDDKASKKRVVASPKNPQENSGFVKPVLWVVVVCAASYSIYSIRVSKGNVDPPPKKNAFDKVSLGKNECQKLAPKVLTSSTSKGNVDPPPKKNAFDKVSLGKNECQKLAPKVLASNTSKGNVDPPPKKNAFDKVSLDKNESQKLPPKVVASSTSKGNVDPPTKNDLFDRVSYDENACKKLLYEAFKSSQNGGVNAPYQIIDPTNLDAKGELKKALKESNQGDCKKFFKPLTWNAFYTMLQKDIQAPFFREYNLFFGSRKENVLSWAIRLYLGNPALTAMLVSHPRLALTNAFGEYDKELLELAVAKYHYVAAKALLDSGHYKISQRVIADSFTDTIGCIGQGGPMRPTRDGVGKVFYLLLKRYKGKDVFFSKGVWSDDSNLIAQFCKYTLGPQKDKALSQAVLDKLDELHGNKAWRTVKGRTYTYKEIFVEAYFDVDSEQQKIIDIVSTNAGKFSEEATVAFWDWLFEC